MLRLKLLKIILPILILIAIPVVLSFRALNQTSVLGAGIDSYSSLFQTVDTVFLVFFAVYLIIGIYQVVKVYRSEGRLPFIQFFKSKKAIVAIAISFIGLGIFIYGMFQPWYKIKADIDSDALKTDGLKDIISVDGTGVKVEKSLLGGLEIPKTNVNILLMSIVLSSIFALLGARSLRSFGKSNIKGGAITIGLVVIIILFAVFMPNIVDIIKQQTGLGKDNIILDAFLTDLANSVSAQPINGQYAKNFTLATKASLLIQWGFELGIYLFLLSGIVKIISGILSMVFSKSVDKKK